MAAEFGARICEGAIDQAGAGVVGRRQVRDDDADVFLFARRREQIGKGTSGDVGDRAITHLLRIEVVEVRRHLI